MGNECVNKENLKMDKSNVKVEFSIYGDKFDPNIITNTMQITPTRSWIKGEVIREGLIRKETCWELATEYEESLDIYEQINKIRNLIKNKRNQIVKVKDTYNLECKFDVVINIENNEIPAMYLDKEIIKFIYELGAEVDFDLYVYS
ncbi:DUF4279 domain-containing protein [Paenibacillus alvei]|nr:DUF4279 domain-containing protein [Paenibacillus alvei]